MYYTSTNQLAKKQGFTLVELSIVIIIIGFLIAGIAAGQSLIKQAELNSVISDMQNYQTAYNSFILRYNAVPGDMTNPDSYWPVGANGCALDNAGDCDGNGDGLISMFGGSVSEVAAALRELALAGMISAGIVPMPDGYIPTSPVLGTNVPTSRVSGAGYMMVGAGEGFGDSTTSIWTDGVTNSVFIGKLADGLGMEFGALKSEDAFNMDKKIDDGTVSGSDFTGANTGTFRSVDSSDTCLAGANIYDLGSASAKCVSGLALN